MNKVNLIKTFPIFYGMLFKRKDTSLLERSKILSGSKWRIWNVVKMLMKGFIWNYFKNDSFTNFSYVISFSQSELESRSPPEDSRIPDSVSSSMGTPSLPRRPPQPRILDDPRDSSRPDLNVDRPRRRGNFPTSLVSNAFRNLDIHFSTSTA